MHGAIDASINNYKVDPHNLIEPYSQFTWILVWIYANFPEIKYAMQNLDKEFIFELGPYAKALFKVVGGSAGGAERNKISRMRSGEREQAKLGPTDYIGKFSNSFLLF